MDKGKFTFELLDKNTPDIVIRDSLEQIEKETKGYVIGNIEKYDGPVYSYTKQYGITEAMEALHAKTVTVDIQNDLGEQNLERNKFEVFLTVKWLEHYKYRMMFVDYSTISYPVTIIMNEELANEYSGRRNDVFIIDSMKELEEMMDTVINSDKMVSRIQSLINESLRQESKNNFIR